jgi:hypothetical protein
MVAVLSADAEHIVKGEPDRRDCRGSLADHDSPVPDYRASLTARASVPATYVINAVFPLKTDLSSGFLLRPADTAMQERSTSHWLAAIRRCEARQSRHDNGGVAGEQAE